MDRQKDRVRDRETERHGERQCKQGVRNKIELDEIACEHRRSVPQRKESNG